MTVEVTAKRVVYFRRSSPRRPVTDRTEYTCTGPDGVFFKNTNKATLSSLLKKRYGNGVTLTFVEAS